eukprot:1741827-Ditylum_brightwellii.AAC.1
MHKRASKRSSWSYHGIEGWYIGPSLDHYHYMECFILSMGATADTDTLKLIENKIHIPSSSDKEVLQQSVV